MHVPFSPPDISDAERQAVNTVLTSGWITTGPRTKLFERELAAYCGTGCCAALSSATAALELTLRILGVGPGDEVITSAYTYSASASVIHHVGAKIVLVDTDPGSYHLDLTSVAAAITQKTKAVIPVDIGGVMADYQALRKICEMARAIFIGSSPYQEALGRVAIIADAAHSLGATRQGMRSGQAADFTCFSFHAVKNLTTAEGGAVTWRSDIGIEDADIYGQFMLYSLHGQTKDALSKSTGTSWEYDILLPGYKANMTDIQAALGSSQLARYEDLLERRRAILRRYDEVLKPLGVLPMKHMGPGYVSSAHLYMVDLDNRGSVFRDRLIERLARIGVSANVHYKPLPLLTAYKNLGFSIEDFPQARHQYENEITLPLFSTMSDAQVEFVIDALGNQFA